MDAVFFTTPAEFRAWLVSANHEAVPELIVGYFKKGTGLPSIACAAVRWLSHPSGLNSGTVRTPLPLWCQSSVPAGWIHFASDGHH